MKEMRVQPMQVLNTTSKPNPKGEQTEVVAVALRENAFHFG